MRLRRFPKKNFWKLLKFTFTQHIMTLKMHLDANRALAQGPSGTVKWRERGWFWTQTQSSYLWWDWYGQHAICNEGVGWERPFQGSESAPWYVFSSITATTFLTILHQHFWRFCINIFDDSSALHILQLYSLPCNQCNYVSSRADTLRRHLKIHSGEKSNKCKQCDYPSSYAHHLKTHLKTHKGEKSNKCKQCDFASSQAGHLRTHLKRHSGEKSNKCNQCNYASSYAGNLRTHLKMHSGEKSNKCNQCDYASSQAGDLRKHLKTHIGEK